MRITQGKQAGKSKKINSRTLCNARSTSSNFIGGKAAETSIRSRTTKGLIFQKEGGIILISDVNQLLFWQ